MTKPMRCYDCAFLCMEFDASETEIYNMPKRIQSKKVRLTKILDRSGRNAFFNINYSRGIPFEINNARVHCFRGLFHDKRFPPKKEMIDKDSWVLQITEKDRSDCPFFYPYDNEMTLEAADLLESRKSSHDEAEEDRNLTRKSLEETKMLNKITLSLAIFTGTAFSFNILFTIFPSLTKLLGYLALILLFYSCVVKRERILVWLESIQKLLGDE